MENKLIKLEKFLNHIKQITKKLNQESKSILSENDKDISLSTDKFLNTQISDYLKNNSIYPILSEEDKNQSDYRDFGGYYWIIDPLDGTLNYSRSIPISCISIALWHNIKPILGIIYNFNSDEMFIGITEESDISKKCGAWFNNKLMQTTQIQNKAQAIICTGFPSWRDFETESLLKLVKKLQEWKKVRLIGSAALSLAWVACARVDAYIEEDIRIWDVAAGLALVKAAGGNIFFKPNERQNFVTAIATNGKIKIEELL